MPVEPTVSSSPTAAGWPMSVAAQSISGSKSSGPKKSM